MHTSTPFKSDMNEDTTSVSNTTHVHWTVSASCTKIERWYQKWTIGRCSFPLKISFSLEGKVPGYLQICNNKVTLQESTPLPGVLRTTQVPEPTPRFVVLIAFNPHGASKTWAFFFNKQKTYSDVHGTLYMEYNSLFK